MIQIVQKRFISLPFISSNKERFGTFIGTLNLCNELIFLNTISQFWMCAQRLPSQLLPLKDFTIASTNPYFTSVKNMFWIFIASIRKIWGKPFFCAFLSSEPSKKRFVVVNNLYTKLFCSKIRIDLKKF